MPKSQRVYTPGVRQWVREADRDVDAAGMDAAAHGWHPSGTRAAARPSAGKPVKVSLRVSPMQKPPSGGIS